jgi:O-acetyl-ADP-ribose deacetylase (regulator of RNase III)
MLQIHGHFVPDSGSKLEYIERGLKTFVKGYQRSGIQSIAFPKLGCGSGGLAWKNVKPMMEKYLKGLPDIDIVICVGRPKPARRQAAKRKRVSRTVQLRLF